MSKRKTHEQFVQEISEKQPHLSVLSEYVNSKAMVLIADNRCDCPPVEKTPGNALKGKGCWKCQMYRNGKMRGMSHEIFVSRVNDINPHLEVVSQYTRKADDISVVDTRCDCGVCVTKAYNITDKRGWNCTICGVERRAKPLRLTHKEYVASIPEWFQVLGEYFNSNTKILVDDLRCDCNPWMAWPLQLRKDEGCGHCSISSGAKKIKSYLDEFSLKYEMEKTFPSLRNPTTGKPLRFDFFVEDRLLIEYDGKQHFQPIEFFGGDEGFARRQQRDQIKNTWASDNGIRLVRIPYFEAHEKITQTLNEET